jgi:hypothetical protein
MSLIVEVPAHLSHSSADNVAGSYCPEEWRPAPGLEGYEVSSQGRMRSWRNRRGWPLDEPVLVGYVNSRGYMVHQPSRRGREFKIHRLVCEAFNGPPPTDRTVCRHLNDVKLDNRPENLAWGTHADNAKDRSRNGRTGPRPGPRKLTPAQVAEIRGAWAVGGTTKVALGRKYGVTDATIGHIVRGVTWRTEA